MRKEVHGLSTQGVHVLPILYGFSVVTAVAQNYVNYDDAYIDKCQSTPVCLTCKTNCELAGLCFLLHNPWGNSIGKTPFIDIKQKNRHMQKLHPREEDADSTKKGLRLNPTHKPSYLRGICDDNFTVVH